MRKICLSFLLMVAAAASAAQGFNPAQTPPWVFADNYGRWAIQGQQPNSYVLQVSGVSPCKVTQLGYGDQSTFLANGNAVTLAPVLINDATAANAEVLTPVKVFTSGSTTCGWSLSATHPHITFNIQSGTGGLQEAINAVGAASAPYPTVIYLTPQWYKLVTGIGSLNATLASQVTPASILANAVCTSKVIVLDITKTPATTYGCSGGSLVVVTSPAVGGVTITGTPSAGQVPTATSGTAATWQTPYTSPLSFLVGLTGTITGTALTAACDSGTATVTGAAAGDPVAVSATTGADVGAAFRLAASVTAANTVTVYICGTGTPASLAYNVVVQHAVTY